MPKPYISLEDGTPVASFKTKSGDTKIVYFNKTDGKGKTTSLHLPFGSSDIQQIPNIDADRNCLYVVGPNGSGKSYYIGKYVSAYKKIFPKNDIILFSKKTFDPSLEHIEPTRIKLDRSLIQDKFNVQDLNSACVIFDDVDTVRDTKVRKEIYSLIDDILCSGRSENITVIVSNHLYTNYKETRIILNECDSITVFPLAGNKYQMNYCLSKYYGLGKEDLAILPKLNSRWVTIIRTFPMGVLYDRGCYLL